MTTRVSAAAVLAVVLVLGAGACRSGSSSDGDGDGELDPRCESLCEDDEAECADAVASCLAVCQERTEGVDSLCATCLLEGAQGGSCAPGMVCCPHPSFSSVLDCVDACQGSQGRVPSGDHPVCTALCEDDEAECAEAVEACLSECRARVEGVSGLCATCLLEDASGGSCGPSMVCCPDPTFPMSVSDCEPVCGS